MIDLILIGSDRFVFAVDHHDIDDYRRTLTADIVNWAEENFHLQKR